MQAELLPFLDRDYYLGQLDENLPEGVSVLEHYVLEGAGRSLSPHPLYDAVFVAAHHAGPGPCDIFDYLCDPRWHAADPHPFFAKSYYLAANPDVAAAGVDAFFHYVHHGWVEGRRFSPLLPPVPAQPGDAPDRELFRKSVLASVAAAGRARSHLLFDPVQEPKGADRACLLDYLSEGWRRGDAPLPLFDAAYVRAQMGGVAANPYVAYLSDFSHRISPHILFDPAYYAKAAAVDGAFQGSLLEHFLRYGADAGISPHPRAMLTRFSPSWHSGADVALGFTAASGRRYALCTVPEHARLAADVSEIRLIEPAVPADYADRYVLHRNGGALNARELAMVTVARKMARCNCMVVSEGVLPDDMVRALASPHLLLATSARPWLVLVEADESASVRYWHMYHGCRSTAPVVMPDSLEGRAVLLAQAFVAGLPDRLLVRTDPLGLAMLRAAGPQLMAAVGRLSLLMETEQLSDADLQFLTEFIATRYARLDKLVCARDLDASLPEAAGVAGGDGHPALLSLGL